MATQLDTCKISQLKALALGLSEDSDVTGPARASSAIVNQNDPTTVVSSTNGLQNSQNRRGNSTPTLPNPISRTTRSPKISTHRGPSPIIPQTQESNPELPSTIPDSVKLRVATMGSQSEGDTQPISQGVIEEYNNRTKLQDAAKQHLAPNEGTCGTHESTERSYHPGQTGHVDLVGAFEPPSRMSFDESSEGDDEDFDPLSPTVDVRAELYPESKRFQLPKTPATNGKKRSRPDEFINHANSTPRLPLNPFAGQMGGLDSIMDASQAFKATQAASSPLGHVVTSDGLSQRPSPDMYHHQRPSTADPPSSPSKMTGLGLVRATTEPQTKYVSMQESQAERDRLAKYMSASRDKRGSVSSDDFGSDNSQLRRRQLQRKIALKSKNQLDGIKAPARPGSSSRRKNNQQTPSKDDFRHRSGRQPSNALIISDDLPTGGNVTEEETEQEEDPVELEAEEPDELADENKENIDVPMTVSKNDDRTTQILASQPTPSRQRHQHSPNTTYTDQAEGSNVVIHSSDWNGEDRSELVETQTSAVADSQSSHSLGRSRQVSKHVHHQIQLSPETRDSTSKVQSSRSPDFSISVPSSSPVLARKSQAGLARGQHKKSDILRAELPANQNPNNRSKTQIEFTLQPTTRSSNSETSGSKDHPSAKMPDQQVGVSIGQPLQYEVSHTPQPVEPNNIASTDIHSSPLSEVPTATPPSTKKISVSKYINETTKTFTAAQSTYSLAKITSKPSSQSALPEVSTGSTPFETARTNLIDSKLNHQCLRHHSGPATSSPALPLRSLAQIAADPSPPDAIGEVDVDINLLTNDDVEFQAVISGSSPIGPRRRRRRDTSGRLTDSTNSSKLIPYQNLYENLRDSAPQDTSTADELATNNPAVGQRTSKNSEVNTTPSSSHDEATVKAQKKTQGSRGRPRKPKPLKGVGTETLVVEKEGKGILSDPTLEISLPVAKALPNLKGGNSGMGANHAFVAPDRVFAHFNGNFSGYYPATCLGVAGVEQSEYSVRFDDGTEDNIRGFGIKRLELQVGDNVKVDLGGSRLKNYVVRRLDGPQLPPNFWQLEKYQKQIGGDALMTDVHGYSSVVVTAKQRRSVGASNDEEHEISVPIKYVYLTQTMWTHFKDRPYSYTTSKAATLSKAQTPSRRLSTPSTPPSREYRTKKSGIPFSRPSKPVSRICTGLFENMIFAVTNIVAENDRKRSTHQIIENGGQILNDGFDELFNIPNLELALPAKQSPKNLIRSKFGLSQSAEAFGFTCLIADKHCRTAKYIQALALGIPCLATRWIQDCVTREKILPWETYLLPSGESSFLGGAIRSRILPPYLPSEATLPSTLADRPKLLDGNSVLLIMSKNEEERMKFFPFFTHALGASRILRAPSLDAAAKAIAKATADGEPWDWIYSHDNEKQTEKFLFGTGSVGRKRKRGSDGLDDARRGKKARVVGNEFVIQSLILGQLVDLD